jgi:hypothetical protein
MSRVLIFTSLLVAVVTTRVRLCDVSVVSEPPFSFVTREPRAFVVFLVVLVPRVSVLDRELPMPLPVRWFIDFVDVNMTLLTQRDQILQPIIVVITVHVMD